MFMQVYSFKKLPELLPTELRWKIIPVPQWLCMNNDCNAICDLHTSELVMQHATIQDTEKETEL